MEEVGWTIDPIPTQTRLVRAAVRSPRVLAAILNRICWNEMRGVEALSIATKYFSRFPEAAISFARLNAGAARHAAIFAARVLDLGGRIEPPPGRSDLINLLPGFKIDEKGDEQVLVQFVARGYVEQYRGMLFYEAMADALQRDAVTQRVFRRIAQDERMQIVHLRETLELLASRGYAGDVSAALGKYRQSSEVVV